MTKSIGMWGDGTKSNRIILKSPRRIAGNKENSGSHEAKKWISHTNHEPGKSQFPNPALNAEFWILDSGSLGPQIESSESPGPVFYEENE